VTQHTVSHVYARFNGFVSRTSLDSRAIPRNVRGFRHDQRNLIRVKGVRRVCLRAAL
jgi:hypothetical protein